MRGLKCRKFSKPGGLTTAEWLGINVIDPGSDGFVELRQGVKLLDFQILDDPPIYNAYRSLNSCFIFWPMYPGWHDRAVVIISKSKLGFLDFARRFVNMDTHTGRGRIIGHDDLWHPTQISERILMRPQPRRELFIKEPFGKDHPGIR